MSTPFDTIHDFALISIQDYQLDILYRSRKNFNTLMDGYLLKSVPYFTNCQKDLTDYDLTLRQFNITLDLTEQIILSNLEIVTWMDAQILDVKQFSVLLNDTDFKTYSSAQNLKAKMDVQIILREKINQDMTNYGVKNIPWTDWGNGVFE